MNKIIQDMIPAKNKPPLREAIPVERTREKIIVQKKSTLVRKESWKQEQEHKERPEPAPPRRPQRGIVGKRTVRPWLFGVIALICLCAIAYAFSIVYARANVTITPTSIVIPVSGTYTAYQQNAAASGTLAYQIIQTAGQQSQTVAASIGPVVSTYARGTVILYNNYSASTQKIVAGTRLSGGNGLIYTTNIAVVIPGLSKGVAGSIAVNVTAADSGPSYNILPSDLINNPSYGDLNIVAYKGTSKYTGFYARLNPSGAGITGGSSGHQIVTSSSTVSSATQSMEQALQKTLLAQSQSLVPAGYVMPANAYGINYTPIAASTTSSTTATVGVQASFYGIIFKTAALAQAIAPTQYSSSFIPEDLSSAQFTITNPQAFSPTNGAPLNFNLKGTLDLVGTLSTSTLASQLAGVSLSSSAAIFKGYSAIATAHATILPFWKRSFPSSPSRIIITIQN